MHPCIKQVYESYDLFMLSAIRASIKYIPLLRYTEAVSSVLMENKAIQNLSITTPLDHRHVKFYTFKKRKRSSTHTINIQNRN